MWNILLYIQNSCQKKVQYNVMYFSEEAVLSKEDIKI